jgi:hypothetical protein
MQTANFRGCSDKSPDAVMKPTFHLSLQGRALRGALLGESGAEGRAALHLLPFYSTITHPDGNYHARNRVMVLESLFASRIMKIVSVILIIAYLMLPVLCFGQPGEFVSTGSQIITVAPDAPGECPFDNDTDNCETTCCCAGHLPLSAFTEIPHADPAAGLLPYEPHLALPRLTGRIFVPPQNLS